MLGNIEWDDPNYIGCIFGAYYSNIILIILSVSHLIFIRRKRAYGDRGTVKFMQNQIGHIHTHTHLQTACSAETLTPIPAALQLRHWQTMCPKADLLPTEDNGNISQRKRCEKHKMSIYIISAVGAWQAMARLGCCCCHMKLRAVNAMEHVFRQSFRLNSFFFFLLFISAASSLANSLCSLLSLIFAFSRLASATVADVAGMQQNETQNTTWMCAWCVVRVLKHTMFAFLMLMMTTMVNRRACFKEPHIMSIDRSVLMFTFCVWLFAWESVSVSLIYACETEGKKTHKRTQ